MKIRAFSKDKGKIVFTIENFYATWLKTDENYFMAYEPDERLLGVFLKDKKLWSKKIESIKDIAFGKNSVYYYNRRKLAVFEKDTGKPLWEKRVPGGIYLAQSFGEHLLLNYSRNKKTYIGFYKNNGELAWEKEISSPLAVPPSLHNQKIFCCLQDGKIITFLTDGTKSWKKYIYKEIISQMIHDDKLFITSKDKIIYGLSLANGSIVWKYDFPDRQNDPNFYMIYYR